MLNDQGAELALAAIPSPAIVRALSQEVGDPQSQSQLWLAYTGTSASRFAGFLVTQSQGLDNLLALCPISPDLIVGTALWRSDIQRQWRLAKTILSNPQKCRGADVISLRGTGTNLQEVPVWVFSLTCIPVKTDWGGQLHYPKPFCPALFESMARQPAAAQWIMRHKGLKDSNDDN